MAAYQQLAKSTSSSTSCTIHNLILKNIGKFIILNLLPKYVHTKKKLLCDLSYIQHPLSCKLKGSQQVRVWHLLGICWVRFSAQKIDLSLSTSLSEKSILPLLVCCYYSANGNYLQSRAILVSSMIIWASFYWLGILFHGPKISREFCNNKNSFSKFTDNIETLWNIWFNVDDLVNILWPNHIHENRKLFAKWKNGAKWSYCCVYPVKNGYPYISQRLSLLANWIFLLQTSLLISDPRRNILFQ